MFHRDGSPSQVSIVAAFSDHSIAMPVLMSVGYGLALLLLALGIYRWRMQTFRSGRSRDS